MFKVVAFLGVFLALGSFFPSWSITPQQKKLWRTEIDTASKIRIAYVWGAFDYKGADCSGIVYATAKRAGIPVRRTTALNMFKGLDGWNGFPVNVKEADELDLIWWTWSERPDRPHGHVGIIVIDEKSKLLSIFHASSSAKRVVIQPYRYKLEKDTSGIKRLK